jgi:hypothetical protein
MWAGRILGCSIGTPQYVNIVAVVSWTEARMSPHWVVAHWLPQVQRTRGSGETTRGIWQAPTLEKDPKNRGLSRLTF